MTTGLSPRHEAPRHGLLPVLMLLLVGLLVGCGASTSHPSGPTPTPTRHLKGTITEFPIPTAHSSPAEITAGPDGNLWFTETANTPEQSGKIGRITPGGAITEFPLPQPATPFGITAGPDGNLWFTEYYGNKSGRITTRGTLTEFSVPTSKSYPIGITAGPDGNLWFTELGGFKIGRITPNGALTEFPTPPSQNCPQSITPGP